LLRRCAPRNHKKMRSYVIASDSENSAAISNVTVGLFQRPRCPWSKTAKEPSLPGDFLPQHVLPDEHSDGH
jgi:hypothetical protein